MPKAKSTSKPAGLPIIHRFAAGIDIGSRFHIAAVSPDLCDEPVQTFRAFTSDLERMADWLVATGTRTVVMESTGVYWVAAYEVLESRGLDVVLANARNTRVRISSGYSSPTESFAGQSLKPSATLFL
jgi:hypothetical protein